jgi:hypothetical protein
MRECCRFCRAEEDTGTKKVTLFSSWRKIIKHLDGKQASGNYAL